MLNLRSLYSFIVVSDHLNISKAAEILHLSQSALSRQIKNLEDELGVQLFDRHGKRLQLTAEAHDLLPRVSEVLDKVNSLSSRMNAMMHGRIGILRIAATPQSIEALLSHVLGTLHQKYPAIEVSFMESSNDSLIEHVQAGVAHVAIASVPDDIELEKIDLFNGYLYAVLPNGHPLESMKAIDIRSLVNVPILSLRRGFMTRNLLDSACAQAGIRLRTILDSDSTQTLCSLARSGLGVAVVSTTALSRYEDVNVRVLTVNGQPIKKMISATWNPKMYRSPTLSLFLQEIQDYLQKNPPKIPDIS